MSDEYVKSTRIIENTWTCNSCQASNLGRYMKCQTCGSAKETDEVDEVPVDTASAPTVTDEQQLKDANAGEDWACEYCQSRVRNAKGECQNCAAKKQAQYFADLEGDAVPFAAAPRLMKRPVPPKNRKPLIGGILGGAVVLGLLIWALIPRHVYATVKSIDWKYTNVVKERKTNHGTGWGTEPESFNVTCERKYKGQTQCNPHNCRPHQVSYSCNSQHYQCNPRSESYDCNCTSRECNCHETCRSNKNGYSTCSTRCSTCRSCSTCSRTVYSTCEKHDTCYRTEYDTCYDSCPVYDQWCEYDYYTWPVRDRLVTSGSSHQTMFSEPPAQTDPPIKTEHIEQYRVVFIEQGGKSAEFVYEPGTLEQYRKFDVGQQWELKVNFGRVTPVEKP